MPRKCEKEEGDGNGVRTHDAGGNGDYSGTEEKSTKGEGNRTIIHPGDRVPGADRRREVALQEFSPVSAVKEGGV